MNAAFHEHFMKIAIAEAEKAAADGEVPAGCVIVRLPEDPDASPLEAKILARSHNMPEALRDATAHAEMLALTAAAGALGAWRLAGTALYVTKEPCPMCAGAISLARVPLVVWGADDPKRGGGSVFGIFSHPGMNHRPETVSGVCGERCADILKSFFRARRAKPGN